MNEGTVARHGVRFRFNFLAGTSYEDEEGNRWTYGPPEPWWDEGDLTPAQLAEVDGWVAEHLAARPQDGEMLARWGNLEHNGIRHTHRKGAPLFDYRPAYGYRCAMCDAYIVNKNPGDYRFVGGPLDGQWIVTDGRRTIMAPVPTPVSVVSDATLSDLAMQTVLYERRGDRYIAR